MEKEKSIKKSNRELTIVTGFFDCGRGKHQEQARSNQKYLDFFRKWARIQNKLIVYTTKEFEKEIGFIRREFGREEQTHIIIIDKLDSVEPEILKEMKKVEADVIFQKWRARDYDVSNLAFYNYIMLMKYWMLRDAISRFPEIETVVWLDFGWNHGGKVFPHEKEFDFLWEYDFDKRKVHLFAKKRPDNELGFLKLQVMTDGIMGSPVICSRNTADKLYMYVKEAMWSLLSLDAMDDDQMLLTMSYKRHPELFYVHDSDWFLPMKEYGGGHLTVREKQNNDSTGTSIFYKIRKHGLKKLIILFYVQYIKHSTLERYYLEKRVHKIFEKVM